MAASINTIELHGASDRIYRAKFGVLFWSTLEERLGLSRAQIVARLRSRTPPMHLLLEFLRTGLVDPANPTLEEAGAILEDIGGLIHFQPALPAAPKRRPRS